MDNTTIHPCDIPLMAKTPRAAQLFDISVRQLQYLRRTHRDFDALTVKIGRDTYYDIPKCYAWFGEFLGGSIEVEK